MRRYDDLAFPDLAAALTDRTVVLWPIGILEEHGPHLPLATDAMQAEWACEQLAAEPETLLLASMRFGNAIATAPYAGTISLQFDTMRALARDVFSELARHGVKRVMAISGHLGQDHMRALRLGASEAIAAHPALRVVVMSDWEVVYELRGDPSPVGELAKLVPEDDGHAGTMETSRMLAIAPQLVRMDRAPRHVAPAKGLAPYQVTRGMDKHYPTGVLGGDASRASAELGAAVNAFVLKRLRAVLSALREADAA